MCLVSHTVPLSVFSVWRNSEQVSLLQGAMWGYPKAAPAMLLGAWVAPKALGCTCILQGGYKGLTPKPSHGYRNTSLHGNRTLPYNMNLSSSSWGRWRGLPGCSSHL